VRAANPARQGVPPTVSVSLSGDVLDYGADLADGLASLLLPRNAPRPPRLFGLLGQLESKKGFEKLLKRDFPHAPLPPPCPETPTTDPEAGAEAGQPRSSPPESLAADFLASFGGGAGLGAAAHAGLGCSAGDGGEGSDDGSDGGPGGAEVGGEGPLSKTALKKQRRRDNQAAAAVADTPLPADSYGHRLLLKMGWKGDGHGLRQDGIASPVRPSANGVDGRPKRRGLTEREDDGAPDAAGKRPRVGGSAGPARQWRLTVGFPSAMAEQAVRRELAAVDGMRVLQAAPEGA